MSILLCFLPWEQQKFKDYSDNNTTWIISNFLSQSGPSIFFFSYLFYLFLSNLPFSILPSTCDFPFTGPLLSYVPLSSLFLPPRCSNYYLEPVESHYDQRMRSTAISATRDDGEKEHRTSCSSPILTHNRYCPFPKALLPIKQAILWTASCNLLKVKLIYRQVLYVPICIL